MWYEMANRGSRCLVVNKVLKSTQTKMKSWCSCMKAKAKISYIAPPTTAKYMYIYIYMYTQFSVFDRTNIS